MQLLILSFICIYIYLFFKRDLWFVCARKEKRGKERRGDIRREEKNERWIQREGERGRTEREESNPVSSLPPLLLVEHAFLPTLNRHLILCAIHSNSCKKKKGRKKKWSYICCPVYSEHSGPSAEFNAHLAPLYSPLVHTAQSSYWGGFLSALFTVAVN